MKLYKENNTEYSNGDANKIVDYEAYADDIALIASKIGEMNKAIAEIQAGTQYIGLALNEEKCETVAINATKKKVKKGLAMKEKIRIQNQEKWIYEKEGHKHIVQDA